MRKKPPNAPSQNISTSMRSSYGYHPFHDLRHTFASDLLLAGVPILKVSRWLGHTSIQMTCDTYGHPLPDPGEHEVIGQLDSPGARGTSWHRSGTTADSLVDDGSEDAAQSNLRLPATEAG